MKHPQFTFDLSRPVDLSRSAFARAPANVAAAAFVEAWPDWPAPAAAIWGPAYSGKTHLGAIWAERAGALRVPLHVPLHEFCEAHLAEGLAQPLWLDEEVGQAGLDETALFHLLNLVREENGACLITSRAAPAKWDVRLPDLASRLKALPVFEIGAPDDTLLQAILTKRFDDMGIDADPSVMKYLLKRMERSYEAAANVARAFEERTLAAHRRATIALASDVLDDLEAAS